MPEDMTTPWRYLNSASSRISSFKGYLRGGAKPQHPTQTGTISEDTQTWREWAGQKIKLGRGPSDDTVSSGMETINLFPGWAARKYQKAASHGLEGAFEVDVFVSGFASSHRSPEMASRSQRAFIRLAKGFASLPKLTADVISPEYNPSSRLSPSTEALLAQIQLPPRPSEITEESEIKALERELRRAKTRFEQSNSSGSSRSSSIDLNEGTAGPPVDTIPRPSSQPRHINPATAIPADVLRKLHANLESRLRPFWSSVLPGRTIRIHLFASPHYPTLPKILLRHQRTDSEDDQDAVDHGPVAFQDVQTAADGSFQARFKVKWEDLCQHPGALHIAFGDPYEEHDLLVAAQLLPISKMPYSGSDSDSRPSSRPIRPEIHTLPSTLHVSITHSPIRVISDIDDTVKLSNILSGARAVFRNVFVKDLQENIIPGMGEWYSGMWSRGIRFHYVSNGPFELLPVLSEFFQVSQLPPGSIKLKSYAGRSLFNGLLSAPAIRKRAGVVDILDSFPDSRFFLIGDSGEQDLELYADLARERSDQILAVFIRDVETGDPIDDPTGWKYIGAAGTRSNPLISSPGTNDTPRPRRTLSEVLSSTKGSFSKTPPSTTIPGDGTGSGDYFTSSHLTSEPQEMSSATTAAEQPPAMSGAKHAPMRKRNTGPPAAPSSRFVSRPTPSPALSISSTSSASSTGSTSTGRMSDVEKRRHMLQVRVNRARTQMPGHIPLRVFRNPNECVEVDEIFGKEIPVGVV